MTPLAPLLEAWLRTPMPVERGASPHTVAAYSLAWSLLVTFAAGHCRTAPSALALEQIDADRVLAFLAHLESGRGNCARTRNARLAAVRSFFDFVQHRAPSALEQVRRILAIPVKKTDSPLIGHLSAQETQALLDAPNPTRPLGIRDRALLRLALAAGLRAAELLGLRLEDLLQQPDAGISVRGKGRRERCLPLEPLTAKALRAWLALRPQTASPYVFLSARNQPLSRDGLAWILRKHAAAAAARVPSLCGKRVFPHLLRHTCAMNVLRGTGDVRKVALWLGHAHLQTTEVYTRADPVEKLEILDKFDLPALRPGRFHAPDRLLALLRASKPPHDYPESHPPPSPAPTASAESNSG